MLCLSSYPIQLLFTFKTVTIVNQTVTIMNHCCYYFDGPWKVKALHVIIMSRTHFRVNMHSVVSLMSKNDFLETGAISEV